MPSHEMGLNECLMRIIALCENPHWTADRKNRIAELARHAQSKLEQLKKLHLTNKPKET